MPTQISKQTAQRVEAVWQSILSRVASGERYSVILKGYDLTYDQMRGYRDSNPALRAEWDSARKDSADVFVDEMVAIAYCSEDDNPVLARVKLDAFTRLIEKLNPERYAPRTRADINVRTVDLTAIIMEAQARVAGYAARTIEHDVSAHYCEAGFDSDVASLPNVSAHYSEDAATPIPHESEHLLAEGGTPPAIPPNAGENRVRGHMLDDLT